MYSNLGSGDTGAGDADAATDMTALGASGEFFPYVYFGLDFDEEA